jgi:hypothetical protein
LGIAGLGDKKSKSKYYWFFKVFHDRSFFVSPTRYFGSGTCLLWLIEMTLELVESPDGVSDVEFPVIWRKGFKNHIF